MEIRNYNQPKEIKLGEVLISKLTDGNFDEILIVSGFSKDSGFDVIMEAISNCSANIDVIIGIDKKNISKDTLMKLLKNNCTITVHINNEENKFETRAYIFKKNNGESYVYLSAGKLSEGGLLENKCLVTELYYSKDETLEIDKFIRSIKGAFQGEEFKKISLDDVISLAESGETAARIVDRKIPSISEMYKKDAVEIGIQQYDESIGLGNNFTNIEDIDFDVSLPIEGEIKLRKSLGEEVEQVIKPIEKKKKVKEEKEEEKKVKSRIITSGQEPEYEKMTTFIMQINKTTEKGNKEGEIKIPHTISENMHKFFDYPNLFHMTEDDKGKLKEVSNVRFEIVDNKNNSTFIDENVLLIQNDKYLSIKSEVLKNLTPDERDIIRVIKNDTGSYKCELIRGDTEEYNVWEGFCVYTIKGYSRKFGTL